MRTLRFLLKKEFKQIFRDKALLRLIFIVPIFQLLILPLVADFEVKDINISIVDHDNSTYSQQLMLKISASPYFHLVDYNRSFRKALTQIENNEADLILEIPHNFEKNLIKDKSEKVFIAINAINGVKGGLSGFYLNQIISNHNNDIRLKWLEPSITNRLPQIEVQSSIWFNPHLNYQFLMVPSILVILVTVMGVYMYRFGLLAYLSLQ